MTTCIRWWILPVLVIIIGGASFTATGIHVLRVNHHNADRAKVVAQNTYVEMVTGKLSTDRQGGVAHLARFVKPHTRSVTSLLKLSVPPDEFNNVNSIIQTKVAFIKPDQMSENRDPRNGLYGDHHLTSDFIVLTQQAMEDPDAALVKVTNVANDEYLTWRNASLITLIAPFFFIVYTLLDFTGAKWSHRRKARKHKKWLASLSSEARDIYRIRGELGRSKPTGYYAITEWQASAEGKAYAKAAEAFTLATKGWTNVENSDRLERLTSELNDLVTAIRAGQQTYREL